MKNTIPACQYRRVHSHKPKIVPLLMALLLCSQTNGLVYAGSNYHVGAGDELSVIFPIQGNLSDLSKLSGNSLSLQIVGEKIYWRHQVIVAPDGYISLPSLPPLMVAGLTLGQIQQLIASNMKSDAKSNLISVVLTRPNSAAFYVWGEVKNPGRFVFERPTNLIEAIGTAGGTTDHARLKHILLLRPGQPVLTLDLSPKHLEKIGPPDIAMQPSDTIMVPKKFITSDSPALFLFLTAVTAVSGVLIATKH